MGTRRKHTARLLQVAVAVLIAPTNRRDDLLPLMPTVHTVFGTMQPGAVVEVDT